MLNDALGPKTLSITHYSLICQTKSPNEHFRGVPEWQHTSAHAHLHAMYRDEML